MSNKICTFKEMLDEYSSSKEKTAELLNMWFKSEDERVKYQREAFLSKEAENHWRKEAEKFERFFHEKCFPKKYIITNICGRG